MTSEMKSEEDQLYDILNLSPPGNIKMTNLMNMMNNQGHNYNGVEGQVLKPGMDSLFIKPNTLDNGPGGPHTARLQMTLDTTGKGQAGSSQSHETMDSYFHKNVNINLGNDTGLSLNSNNPNQLNGELLSPTNMFNSQNHLHPQSPSVYSTHSLYSDTSLNPGSPYIDAASHFSNGYSDMQPIPQQLQYLDTDAPHNANFDNEIALGGSISSTNLIGMSANGPQNQQVPQFNYSVTQAYSVPNDNYNDSHNHGYNQANNSNNHNYAQNANNTNRLTENNLTNYNNTLEQESQKEVKISIQQAPEALAANTPSLFSNSSQNSSNNSPHQPSNNTNNKFGNELVPNYQLTPTSPGSVFSDVSDEQNALLNPEEYQNMKRGRRKSHSALRSRLTSRSRSKSVSSDIEDAESTSNNGVSVSSREKMLELASPNQSSKRTQKHPSVYACHLCEKRFTRPYNLKSHLRTHTDERPFICNVCGKAFARQHDRKRHEDLHTGEKKFQCKGFLKNGTPYGCGRKFARADALRRHFQTEAGKECIRVLVEEDENDRGDDPMKGENEANGMGDVGHGHLSPTSALIRSTADSMQSIPQVAISPPD